MLCMSCYQVKLEVLSRETIGRNMDPWVIPKLIAPASEKTLSTEPRISYLRCVSKARPEVSSTFCRSVKKSTITGRISSFAK